MKNRTRIAIGAIVVLVALVAVFLIRGRAAGEPDGAKKYKTEAVGRGNVTMTVTATGTVSAVTTVQVGSQVSGVIARLYVDFMSPVHKGQLLAELDPTNFQAQVEQRRADLLRSTVDERNSAVQYQRQKRLLDSGLAAQADVDNSRAAL